MPKAVLGTNLVDSLVPVVDSLRASLHPAMGVRQFRVFLVKRAWSGRRRFEGVATITQDEEILPQPKVDSNADLMSARAKYDSRALGAFEDAEVSVTEISLSYAEDELTGRPTPENEEFYYRIVDAHGQGHKTRYYVPSGPPTADREKDIGWRIELKLAEITE